MKIIWNSIVERFNRWCEDTAQSIRDSNWSVVGWNIALALAIVMVVVALAVAVLALVGKILGTVLGKIFSVPLVLLIIGLVYDNFFAGSRNKRKAEREAEELEAWAGRAYEYVRDSMFYVVQAMADRMKVVKPHSPHDIEMGNRFFCQGNYTIFQFYVQLWETLDKSRFEQKLTDTISQMHRDHRLVGIPSDLVEVNHRYYCPLLVLNVEPFDDGYTVQVVFADEETVPLVDRAKQRNRKAPSQTLYDDEP